MTNDVIIGVDEVGRGCLAGDVVVCAFALFPWLPSEELEGLRAVAMDSKAFSSRARREASLDAVKRSGFYAFARRTPVEIERMNIRAATLDAMAEATRSVRATLRASGVENPCTIIDGRDVPPGLEGKVQALVKGDATVLEISCASMLAKVKRDLEMVAAAEAWPGYGFERHAGYGTRQHIEGIRLLGLCPIHRSWAGKFLDTAVNPAT